MEIFLWKIDNDVPSRFTLVEPYWLTTVRNGEVEMTTTEREDAAMVLSIDRVRQMIAVLFVPDQAAGRVAHNGLLLAHGLHGLRHADCLEMAGKKFWISGTFTAEETKYDPGIHARDAYCFLTKARLHAGDPIAICPGTEQTACQAIYSRPAWESVRQSPRPFCCPNCGFDPARSAWAPPVRQAASPLESLLQLTVGGDL